MKKGCIIVLVVLAVLFILAIVGGVIAFNVFDKQFGIRMAPEISHEVLSTANTRVRMVIKPELLAPYLVQFIPEDVEVNTYGYELQEIMGHILPREIAILARSDMAARNISLTIFANEKRGGPFISAMINQDSPFDRIRQIAWRSAGLELQGRGTLVAEGDLAIPAAVEEELLQIWPIRSSQPPATIQGNNQVELVIDNMNGDILTLAAAGAAASGKPWEEVRQDQAASMAIGVIKSINVARMAANMIDKDTAEISLNIDADPDSGAGLQFLISGVGLPQLKDLLKEDFGLILAGDSVWDEEKHAVVGQYTLTGLEAFIKEQLDL
jgi:hypothetical protein